MERYVSLFCSLNSGKNLADILLLFVFIICPDQGKTTLMVSELMKSCSTFLIVSSVFRCARNFLLTLIFFSLGRPCIKEEYRDNYGASPS